MDYNYYKNTAIGLLWGLLLCALLSTLGGCKTKYVSVPEYHKEYVSRTDSFFHTDTIKEKEWMTIKEVDSTQLAELGIQLKNIKSAYLIERNKNRERSNTTLSAKTDTIFKTDSIRVPYPVEKKLSHWQKLKMDVGGIAMGVCAALILSLAVYFVRKFKLI